MDQIIAQVNQKYLKKQIPDVQTGDNLNTGPGATTDWAEASWSDVAGGPATVTYHERRRWYARTATQPQTQWASKHFVYDDFIPCR